MNDIDDWLADENGEDDEIGDNLDELCGEEETESSSSEKCLEEKQQSEEPEDKENRQQRYRPRKQLTRSRNFSNIDSSLDEKNYKEVVFMKKDCVLEERYGYLGPKKDKNTKKIWWSLEHPVATDRQRKCDTISDRIILPALNSRANNIENIKDTLHLYFDNYLMDKIVDCTNTRINETIAQLQRSNNFNESSKYT